MGIATAAAAAANAATRARTFIARLLGRFDHI
jgi:hypothetical protein